MLLAHALGSADGVAIFILLVLLCVPPALTELWEWWRDRRKWL